MTGEDLLIEIGCEELPASSQQQLATALCFSITRELKQNNIKYGTTHTFATPRRIAVLIKAVSSYLPAKKIEKLGPSVHNAYDSQGMPTIACMGFARACGVSADQLFIKESEKSEKSARVAVTILEPGKNTRTLIPQIMTKALNALTLKQTMRWGHSSVEFVRPVHWVLLLFGDTCIQTELLGKKTSAKTYGHRFMSPHSILISHAKNYESELYTKGCVIADFSKRMQFIEQQLNSQLNSEQHVILDKKLLTEVTSLVEWPMILPGTFDKEYLSIPSEVLITSMQTHQKCFAIANTEGELENYFLLVSNIASKDPQAVIRGNERVIRARLRDAQFFYQNDLKTSLASHSPRLKSVTFHAKLGSLYDKSKRIAQLAQYIAKKMGIDSALVKKAAMLSKCDLLSSMVREFPQLQGNMGYYYALNDQQELSIAKAIKEHYRPRFSGDQLPSELIGAIVGLADKLDTLVAILGINEQPSADKDPYALRRAAIGIIRILIEKKLPLDLIDLLKHTQKGFTHPLPNKKLIEHAADFIHQRLKAWYLEKNVMPEVFLSVAARNISIPYDFDQRIKAVQHFQTLPEAVSLSAANKRVSNILKKNKKLVIPASVDSDLFLCDAERTLANEISKHGQHAHKAYLQANYAQALSYLAELKEPIDVFFDQVMIMDKDESIKKNRMALLVSIHELFIQVADVSLLNDTSARKDH